MPAQLRVYPSSEEAFCTHRPAPAIGVRLRDLLPLVAMAQRHNYLWLQDFLDDDVRVTADLYEVLRAFGSYRPSA